VSRSLSFPLSRLLLLAMPSLFHSPASLSSLRISRPFSVTAKCTMINNGQDGGSGGGEEEVLSLWLRLCFWFWFWPLRIFAIFAFCHFGRPNHRPVSTHTHTHTLAATHTRTHSCVQRRRRNTRARLFEIERRTSFSASFLAPTCVCEGTQRNKVI